jgi:ethanolamine utilization protein EutQ (cupin superfamily)
MVLEGEINIAYPDGKEKASAGDTVLIPASLEQITPECHKNAEILEVYIK